MSSPSPAGTQYNAVPSIYDLMCALAKVLVTTISLISKIRGSFILFQFFRWIFETLFANNSPDLGLDFFHPS